VNRERDAKRNIGEELLAAVLDVKAGRHGVVHRVEPTEVAAERQDDLELAKKVRARLSSDEKPVKVSLDELIDEAERDVSAGELGDACEAAKKR
jgi:hypothetical protein